MNLWGTGFLTFVAVVLQIIAAQQEQSLGLSLCLNILGGNGGCQNGGNTDMNGNSIDPYVVLRNGFSNCYNMVLAAENKAIKGFSLANQIVSTRPGAALQTIQDAIEESKNTYFEAGAGMFLSMGKALRLSNDAARQGLIGSTQILQVVALRVLDEMRTASALANQGVPIGEDAAKQVIEGIRQNTQVTFAPVYDQLTNAYQKAIDAITYAQNNPMTRKASSGNVVNEVKDTDARAAVSELNQAAANSIRRGSTASRVNQLIEALITSFTELAEDTSFIRNQTAIIQNLAPGDDQSSAKNSFLKGLEAINRRIQKMFLSICLEFGSAAPNLSEQQIGKAIIDLEHGNDEVTYANGLAREMVLSAFKQEGNARKSELDAAVQIARYGQNAFNRRINDGAKIVINFL